MTKQQEQELQFNEQPQHTIGGGQINETPGNLFDYENDYALAHCISADFALGAGIAKYFQARYGTRDELRQTCFPHVWNGHGYCLLTNNDHVFNLVTKNRYFEKPTLNTMREALIHMRIIAEERGIHKIAMPRIGCGLDRLQWQDVKDILMEVYGGSDLDIRVVYLNEYLDGKILDPDTEKINFGKDRQHIDGNLEKKYF
jgi:O-acetyl-ADP-ribose deacetylase (regulator of RNase III)